MKIADVESPLRCLKTALYLPDVSIHRFQKEEELLASATFVDHSPRLITGTLWPCITAGRSIPDDMVLSELQNPSVLSEVIRVRRGGRLTAHGPGQLVCFPVLPIQRWKKHIVEYLRWIEQVVIHFLAKYDIQGESRNDLTGVWARCGESWGKICSIGVYVKKGITRHGFSINVCIADDLFSDIIPCGNRQDHIVDIRRLNKDGIEWDMEQLHREISGIMDVAIGRWIG